MKKTRVRPRPQPQVEKPPDPAIISLEVNKAVDNRLAVYKERLRYFLYGLTSLIALLVGAKLIAQVDIIRWLHNQAFPPPPNLVAYSRTLTLKPSDERLKLGVMEFYAKEHQRVEALVVARYRQPGDKGLHPVTISFEDNLEGEDLYMYLNRFIDITDRLGTKQLLHKIGFSLVPDTSSAYQDSPQVIDITCIVHVYDKEEGKAK